MCRAALLVGLCWAAAACCARGYQLEGELGELARALRDNCLAESGVQRAVLERVDAGADLPAERTLQCYLKCVMEMGGMLDAGRVDVDAMLELLPAELAASIERTVRACGTQPGADDCEVAYNTQRCWQANNRPHYFLV